MKPFKALILILAAAMLLPLAASCGQKNTPRSVTYYEYFDTVSTVSSFASDGEEEFEKNCALIEGELKEYHRLFDIYREYSGMNNLRTVNLNAGISPIRVDRKIIDLLLFAKEAYTLTGGEVNVAMGAVLSLWHDCREAAEKAPSSAVLPDSEALLLAGEHISIDSIIIDEEASTVFISDSSASIDVGAVGKGFAAERIAQRLSQEGIGGYVLDIGRSIRTVGTKPDGSGWITGITNPDLLSDKAYAARVTISNTSCVTSGSYQRHFTVNGKSYHHIIDRDTLYPSEHFVSVTVITPDNALADVLSTALFCMTYEDGLTLIESLESAEALWICGDGRQLYTEGFEAIMLDR